jgi:hypothetical protein
MRFHSVSVTDADAVAGYATRGPSIPGAALALRNVGRCIIVGETLHPHLPLPCSVGSSRLKVVRRSSSGGVGDRFISSHRRCSGIGRLPAALQCMRALMPGDPHFARRGSPVAVFVAYSVDGGNQPLCHTPAVNKPELQSLALRCHAVLLWRRLHKRVWYHHTRWLGRWPLFRRGSSFSALPA